MSYSTVRIYDLIPAIIKNKDAVNFVQFVVGTLIPFIPFIDIVRYYNTFTNLTKIWMKICLPVLHNLTLPGYQER